MFQLKRTTAVCVPTTGGSGSGHDAMLAGLAEACGLGPRIAAYGPGGCLDQLPAVLAGLGPDLRELITALRSAVASAVLSART